ncbi:MAG TPA: DUF2147 domain-containing protein [Polyangiaceae bacterium]|nr:DUF2147 domain-containing protein [Polyangiaceae bacterium]
MRTFATIAVGAALSLVPCVAMADENNERRAQKQAAQPSILGEWWTERKDGRIRFVKHVDGTYRGIVSWGAEPRKDTFNKDPKLRDRPVLGMVLMWNLVYRDGKYEGGYVYNPEDGRTYRVAASLNGFSSLKLRGYLGIPLLGQTQNFTRYR